MFSQQINPTHKVSLYIIRQHDYLMELKLNYKKATEIPRSIKPEKKIITSSVRPQRLGFIINSATPIEEVYLIIQYCSSIWGGINSIFIPTNGKEIEQDWWQMLLLGDPDRIIYIGTVDTGLIGQIEEEVQPFEVLSWHISLVKSHWQNVDHLSSIQMYRVLNYELEKVGRIEGPSRIVLSKAKEDNPWNVTLKLLAGHLDETYEEIYKNTFKAETLMFDDKSFGDQLELLGKTAAQLTPLSLTSRYLDFSVENAEPLIQPTFVLMKEDDLNDLCLFWNFRSLACFFGTHRAFPIPFGLLKDGENLKTFLKWCDEISSSTFLTIMSSSLSRQALIALRDRIRKIRHQQTQYVEIIYRSFSQILPASIQWSESKNTQEVTFEEDHCRIKSIAPQFIESLKSSGYWLTDIEISGVKDQSQGYIIPKRSEIGELFQKTSNRAIMRPSRVRITNKLLTYGTKSTDSFIDIELKSFDDIVCEVFKKSGYESGKTANSRYIRGVLSLVESFQETEFLTNDNIRRLLKKMTRENKALTVEQISGICKSDESEMVNLVTQLARKGVFLRGYNLDCPVCDLKQWYPQTDVKEAMNCAGCLSKIQPPVLAQFAYMLNDLFSNSIEQGSLPVILTLRFLKSLCQESFMFVPCIAFKQLGNQEWDGDIDIVALCDGMFVLVECKSLEGLQYGSDTENSEKQTRALVQISENIGGSIVFLSTLAKKAPKGIEKMLRMSNSRANTPSHCLVYSDLETGRRIITENIAGKRIRRTSRLTDFAQKPATRIKPWRIREEGNYTNRF